MSVGLDTVSKTAWISEGFEWLVDRVRKAPAAVHFDVLIVGSGYGGAIAAATFAGRQKGGLPVTVAVLERGNEYLPGSFPSGLAELPRHVRRDQNKEGLFDIRIGGDVTTVVANGVGGGSLINAGVMEVPLPSVFAAGWPSGLSNLSSWRTFFDLAGELLGATIKGSPNTFVDHVDGVTKKYQAISAIAPSGTFRPAAITVAMTNTTSSANVQLNKCVRCGDCATGCNFGAKNSLDVNLLTSAQQSGAEIFSGATVLSVEQDGLDWIVNAVHTNAVLRQRDGEVVRIRAHKVVLAAGTLGSTEILMRSRDLGLPVANAQLGQRCSTNGDMLITDYDTATDVHTVADETDQPSTRAIGPTITGIIDLRNTSGVTIEEMSVPAGLRIAFTEIFSTVNALHSLAEADTTHHSTGFPIDDIYVAPKKRIEHSALYAVMADDGAAGKIELDGDSTSIHRDGIAGMRWPGLGDQPVFDDQVTALAQVAQTSGGRLIPNPVWKLLPKDLTWLLQDQRGPLTTVHPLGGCAMADIGAAGVVDEHGQVFSSGATDDVHDGLVVLDGSIIPTALGTNPSLTIAAVALRAAEALAKLWGYTPVPAAPFGAALVRPVFRSTDVAAPPPSTQVEIVERLVGPVRFKPQGDPVRTSVVELTLRFAPIAVNQLTPSNGGLPVLTVATSATELEVRSRIRIFPLDKWTQLDTTWDPPLLKEQKLDAIVDFSAPLTGKLRIFERQADGLFGVIGRGARAIAAYLGNRGWRDRYQWKEDGDDGPGTLARIAAGLKLATRSGEIRTLTYDLTIGTPEPGNKITLSGNSVVGTKTFTYERRANPWRQLMEVALDTFPGLRNAENVLKLDTRFLARIGVPLFRLVGQHDGASAIGELVTFLGYVLRLLLGIHIWSFRAPDKDIDPGNDVVNRLPPLTLDIPGGAPVTAEIHTLPVPAEMPDYGQAPVPGNIRLTRYPQSGTTTLRPIVMLHGYSASGTTFAHHAVTPNFASYFWQKGRDVWIADIRTSAGMPTATDAWSFDQVGEVDVPLVLNHVASTSVDGTVDVIAHCMGTIALGNAVLGGHVPGLVSRAALTQVAPLVVFSPANIFRAYLLKYLVDFLPDTYSFSPPSPTLADDLLDRVLSTLPYPVEEFDYENPTTHSARTPWTRTRHRMDALYGRDFNVAHMEPEMLRFIDDHFGPLSLKTVAQTLHFVRFSMMTDYRGRNRLVSRDNFSTRWKFPTFSVHGSDNGLAHVSTVDRMSQILEDAGCTYVVPFINPGAGHQDALVGDTRGATLLQIDAFFNAPITLNASPPSDKMVAYPPWIGPIVTEQREKTSAAVLRVGSAPTHRAPQGVLMLRVDLVGNDILRPDDPTQPWTLQYILDHMVVLKSTDLETKGWDAFEAPLPTLMPLYDPAHPGNALLVLLVYAEASALESTETGYFFAFEETIQRFHPSDPHKEPPGSGTLAYKIFSRMCAAALDALRLPPIRLAQIPGHPAAPVRRLVEVRPREVSKPTLNLGPQPTITSAPMQLMSFSTADPKTGEAVLDTLLDQDRDLLDGVVPYDPPQSPPTSPPAGGQTRFALASCQYPAGFIDDPVAYRGYKTIVTEIEAAAAPLRFAVFAGDQVYVDPTAGLYDPSAADDRYQLPYEAWLRARNVRDALRRIPSFMLLDDHEIGDNWEPISSPDDAGNAQHETDGFDAFEKYQRGIPKSVATFAYDGFSFFMLDTRTHREHRKVDAGLATAKLFDSPTMTALRTWLKTTPGPKFVVSPAMLLPRHRRTLQRDKSLDPANLNALHSDGWDGYPNSLREVLAFIAANGIGQVVFLSGDEHRGCVAEITLLDTSNNVVARAHSVHAAALYAPFPFANSLDEDVVPNDTFPIAHALGNFKCVVTASRPTPPSDGPTFLTVYDDGKGWKLDIQFPDAVLDTRIL